MRNADHGFGVPVTYALKAALGFGLGLPERTQLAASCQQLPGLPISRILPRVSDSSK